MNLQELLTKDNIIYLTSSTIKESIGELLRILQGADQVSKDPVVLNSILKNEFELCSAAGRGLAYPNGVSPGLLNVIPIIGISNNGIPCDSPDGLPCHIIVLTVSPETEPDSHIKFISLFQTMISDAALRADIIDSENIQDVLEIIHNWHAELIDPEDDDV